MSGADWFAVAMLAGALVLSMVLDWWQQRVRDSRIREYDRQAHDRLLRELERQP